AGSTVRIRRWGIESATVAFAIRVLIKSKLEIRNSKQFLIGKNHKDAKPARFEFCISDNFGFRFSHWFRISIFGFRIFVLRRARSQTAEPAWVACPVLVSSSAAVAVQTRRCSAGK